MYRDSPRFPTFSLAEPTTLSFALFNGRSLKSKRLLIKDYIVENYVDIFALAGTWLHSDDRDDQLIGDLIPTGYSFHHVPRQLGNGGGVGINSCQEWISYEGIGWNESLF